MPYRIAGIDVHKKMLAVVVADVEVDGEFDFERQKAGTTPTSDAAFAGSSSLRRPLHRTPPPASFAISTCRPRSLRPRRPVRHGRRRVGRLNCSDPFYRLPAQTRGQRVYLQRVVGAPPCHGTRVRDRVSLRRRGGEGTIAERPTHKNA